MAVIQCEEFEATGLMATKSSTGEPATLPAAAEYAPHGLCANCANRLSCALPNARNGVLECEEYALEEAPAIPIPKTRRISKLRA